LKNGNSDSADVFMGDLMAQSTRYALNKNKYLLEPELTKLNALLDYHMDEDTRNCILLKLALKTGARAQELLNLKKIDLNIYEESVLIKGIKGSNDREIPLKADLFRQLKKYADTLDSELLFPISYSRLRQVWDFYRPVPKKFHSLRHTFAIQIYKKTRDIRLVQVALGHRNVMNTMIYADYVYSHQELKKLIL
jgi:integrase